MTDWSMTVTLDYFIKVMNDEKKKRAENKSALRAYRERRKSALTGSVREK